jgi:hypothetical protein
MNGSVILVFRSFECYRDCSPTGARYSVVERTETLLYSTVSRYDLCSKNKETLALPFFVRGLPHRDKYLRVNPIKKEIAGNFGGSQNKPAILLELKTYF